MPSPTNQKPTPEYSNFITDRKHSQKVPLPPPPSLHHTNQNSYPHESQHLSPTQVLYKSYAFKFCNHISVIFQLTLPHIFLHFAGTPAIRSLKFSEVQQKLMIFKSPTIGTLTLIMPAATAHVLLGVEVLWYFWEYLFSDNFSKIP